MKVAIGIISFRRPDGLARLLATLDQQQLPDDVEMSILVVDNDAEGSAAPVVEAARAGARFPITYVVEPEPGIPFARQRSVDETRDADALVFVDDDEWVDPTWLAALVEHWQTSGADVVTGPVKGELPAGVPAWNAVSDVHSSVGRHETGARLTKAYTNNTLVSRAVLDAMAPGFDPAFRFIGGSDLNYFQRVHRLGFTISWCEEAVVHEDVPLSRTNLGWLVRRGYRAGAGDTISRTRISPGIPGRAASAVLGLGRLANGVALSASGAVLGRRDQRIKGVRRIASGVGSLAGLVGLSYEEYKR